MAQSKWFVFSNAVPGREIEFEHWYVNEHIPDVLRIAGVVSGQHFRLMETQSGYPDIGAHYLGLYEMETDDPQAIMDALRAKAGAGAFRISDSIDLSSVRASVMQAIGPLQKAGDDP